jgi:hypothetical protein
MPESDVEFCIEIEEREGSKNRRINNDTKIDIEK